MSFAHIPPLCAPDFLSSRPPLDAGSQLRRDRDEAGFEKELLKQIQEKILQR